MDSMSHGRAPVGDGDKQPAGGGVQRPLGAGDSLQAARRGRRPEGVLFLLLRRPRVWEGLGATGSRRRRRRGPVQEPSSRPTVGGTDDDGVLPPRSC